jgi:hypothetical protein
LPLIWTMVACARKRSSMAVAAGTSPNKTPQSASDDSSDECRGGFVPTHKDLQKILGGIAWRAGRSRWVSVVAAAREPHPPACRVDGSDQARGLSGLMRREAFRFSATGAARSA